MIKKTLACSLTLGLTLFAAGCDSREEGAGTGTSGTPTTGTDVHGMDRNDSGSDINLNNSTTNTQPGAADLDNTGDNLNDNQNLNNNSTTPGTQNTQPGVTNPGISDIPQQSQPTQATADLNLGYDQRDRMIDVLDQRVEQIDERVNSVKNMIDDKFTGQQQEVMNSWKQRLETDQQQLHARVEEVKNAEAAGWNTARLNVRIAIEHLSTTLDEAQRIAQATAENLNQEQNQNQDQQTQDQQSQDLQDQPIQDENQTQPEIDNQGGVDNITPVPQQ